MRLFCSKERVESDVFFDKADNLLTIFLTKRIQLLYTIEYTVKYLTQILRQEKSTYIMNVKSKIVCMVIAFIALPNLFATKAISETKQKAICPNPFPSNYKSPAKTKYVNIAELGISVRTPVDHRLVYISKEKKYTFMAPPEYKSYQCSVAKKVDYNSFYRYPRYLGYTIIDNSKKLPLDEVVKGLDKDVRSSENYGRIRLNNIDFLTTPINQGDPTTGWFVPKTKLNIIVRYSSFCDCGSDYQDLTNDLSDIKNMAD
jgi:hypothetical protein